MPLISLYEPYKNFTAYSWYFYEVLSKMDKNI